MESLNTPEIQRSHTAKSQVWKPLIDVVDAVNCDAHDKLATFIHRQLPETGDTDRRKAFMLNYLLPQRNNWLKLKTLVSWSEKAGLVRDYEIHYKDVQRQKFISNEVEAKMREWSFHMPSSSLRSPDVTSSSDVLKEGTYKRFPSIIKECFAPDVLDDDKAKETLEALNGIIQIRMLTQEIIPKCMRNYRIMDGKIKFIVDKEFEAVLTPDNMEIDSHWWIIELKFLIQSASNKIFNDVKLSIHDKQISRLIETIQKQYLSPPQSPIPERISSSMKRPVGETLDATSLPQTAKFCPLVNLYEYLHNYCLDLQLNVLVQQAYYMRQTRWANNFDMSINDKDSVLKIYYWNYIKQALAVKSQSNIRPSEMEVNHDIIEISVITKESDRHLLYSSNKALKRSHWYTDTKYVKLGALNDIRGINYPHKFLRVRWTGLKGSEANEWIVIDWEFDPTNLNLEHLMLSVTQRHAQAVINKFVDILKNDEKGVYTEDDFEIVGGSNELVYDLESSESPSSDEVARKYLNVQKLRVLLCGDFKDCYINIGIDIHSGRIFIEDEKQEIDSDKIKACEDKLSYDHNKLVEVLIMLRSVVMISRLESMARKLFLDVPREIQLRPEDNMKLRTNQKIILEFNDAKDVNKMLSHEGINDKLNYLIVGLVESGIVYNLAELSRMPPSVKFLLSELVKEPSHKITSHRSIRLGNTIFDIEKLKADSHPMKYKYLNEYNHRKRNFDKMNEDEIGSTLSRPSKRTLDSSETDFNSFVIDELLLSRIVSIARSRIDYERIVTYFSEEVVKLEPIKPSDILRQIETAKCMSPEVDFDKSLDKSLDFLDANTPLSLSTIIPTFKISIKSLLARFPRANDLCLSIFSDVFVRLAGTRLTKMTNPEVILTTCLQSKYIPRMIEDFLHTNITYDQSSGILTFRYKYKNKKNFVKTFLKDFEEIVMMTQAASECKRILCDKKKNDINIIDYDFDTLKLQYDPYGVDISWRNDEYVLTLYVYGLGTELHAKEVFSNPYKDKLHAFLKEELNSAYIYNFDKFVDSLRIIPSVIRFLVNLSTKDNHACELQVIPKGATKFHLIWNYSIPPTGQKTWCGMDINFVPNKDETHFFASDLANLKEYRDLKPEKMPIWQAFEQELVNKQEIPLSKVQMFASGFTSPRANFEKIMEWIDEYVRKRAPWLNGVRS
ncbi:hypothetical protein RclHR1_06170012 [Rhizophagus clarus]|uniref:Mediator of RNA polymerase II transcription subunit 14 n=1 Tax=Rhizophagus clarus TaxID=94130 RepID=A0A2Z6RQG8_9GLOM|nr:hypothetical protein RclHR1_06170012 [Rhizophagus clarus]GES76667.1 MED14-domain-containing protein [Rhizophagus clarus]